MILLFVYFFSLILCNCFIIEIGDPKTNLEFIGNYIDWNTLLKTNTMQISVFVVIGVLIAQGSILLLTLYIWYPEQNKIERSYIKKYFVHLL